MTAIDDKCRECGQRFSLIDGMVTSCLIDKALTMNVVKDHRFSSLWAISCAVRYVKSLIVYIVH